MEYGFRWSSHHGVGEADAPNAPGRPALLATPVPLIPWLFACWNRPWPSSKKSVHLSIVVASNTRFEKESSVTENLPSAKTERDGFQFADRFK
jgi:hypothetical protein